MRTEERALGRKAMAEEKEKEEGITESPSSPPPKLAG